MEIDFFKRLTKYPFISADKEFYDSIELEQNKSCKKKCKKKDCLELIDKAISYTEYTCSMGYDNILFTIGEMKILINGLIFENNKSIPQGRKELKQKWITNKADIDIFLNKIQEIENYIKNRMNETIEQNFAMFHDFKTSMAIIINCTQDIINQQEGESFEMRLASSSNSTINLFHALDLLTSQVGMMDVILNPTSIKYGVTKQVSIYKLFDKMLKLFEHMAQKRRIRLQLINEGNCFYPTSNCYESIEFIPLIVLDNAIKYSNDNSDIQIKFSKTGYNRLKVEVINFGPIVSDESIDKIFQKFYRDKNAISFTKKGTGIGLWTARQVLQAHDSNLFYKKEVRDNNTHGKNIFYFELTTN